jgi:hypothetical protein
MKTQSASSEAIVLKKGWRFLIFVVFCYSAAGGLWYWYLTSRPLTEDDFSTIEGTFKSAEEKRSSNQLFLELYIVESSIRFRVPVDSYEKSFNREAFFANVKPGTKISIKVKKAQLDKPTRPWRDPVDTVFVYGLKDDRLAYSEFVVRRDWEEMNQITALILAIVLSFGAIGITILYVKAPSEDSLSGGRATS